MLGLIREIKACQRLSCISCALPAVLVDGPASPLHSPTNSHPRDAVTPLLVTLPAEGWHHVGTEPSDPNMELLAPDFSCALSPPSPPHADLSPPAPACRACAISLVCLSPKVRRERA